jgi:GntR family transcriptional regulator
MSMDDQMPGPDGAPPDAAPTDAARTDVARTDAARTEDRPRYAVISDTLRQRIEAGTYPLGDFLPTENELCEEFGISRHTVREALRRLSEAGLIQRRQGSGSQVTATRPHQTYVHAMRSLNELFQYAADTRFRIGTVRMGLPGPEHAEDLGAAVHEDWLIAEGLRLEQAEDLPICFSLVFINRAFAAIAQDLPGLKGAIYRHVEDRFGVEVALVEQDIRVTPLPSRAAVALGAKPKALAVRVLRRYLGADGRLLLASVNHHPAERFTYAMRLRREGPKGNWS